MLDQRAAGFHYKYIALQFKNEIYFFDCTWSRRLEFKSILWQHVTVLHAVS